MKEVGQLVRYWNTSQIILLKFQLKKKNVIYKKMQNKISPIINAVSNISKKSTGKIADIAKYKHYKKGELITSVGQKNNLEYFITSG